MISIMQNKKNVLIKIAAVAFWVAVWCILSLIQNNRLLIPSPVDTVVALVDLMGKADFYVAVAGSLIRIMCGFGVAMCLGVLLGYLGYRVKLIREFTTPLAGVCKSVPVAAFAVILLILFGHEQIGFYISLIVVFPVVFISVSEGLDSVDGKLLEMASVFKMSQKNRLMYIFRPALKPYICSSVKTGIGMAWKAGVAAEVIGLTSASIGGELYESKVYFETAQVFAWAVVTVLLSFILEKLVLWLVRLIMDAEVSCTVEKAYQSRLTDVIVEKLYKAYGDKALYVDYSERFERGGRYTISTPSGSGKTTLLQMIAGNVSPDKGEVKYASGDEGAVGGQETSVRVSMVFQEDRLSEEYSAVRNVCMVGIGEKAARDALSKVLDSESLDKPCRELSGGMKRRVAIVRALTYPSDIVLMDEPYTGMDEETIKCVKAYIDEAIEGRTMIVATHIL